jgi:hypothetical protein
MEIGMNSSILGNKFGKWTVLDLDVDSADKNYIKFICKCDCGKTKSVYKHHLTSNQSTSCGCSRKNRSNWKPRKDIKKNGGSGFNYYYSTYKRNAKKRSLSFELTKDDFFKLTKGDCNYCGSKPKNEVKYSGKKNTPPYICNGVDRVNNKKGYTIENSVSCCSICNRAKKDLSLEEFNEWIKNIKPKKDYFFTKSGPTAMFDIDDTLILWNTPEGHEDREVKIDCEGVISYRVPNIYNINLLKKFYESGHIVILWSGSGVRWCKAVAKALNIENYIDGCISKPQYYIDDKANPKEWIGKHVYFDYNGNRIHGDNFAEMGEVNE